MVSTTSPKQPLTLTERKAIFSLAGIYGLRMMGLFLVLPVFALYAASLEGATPFLIGLTLGAYGLTQAILQIPFGLLSDRWGRKPVLYLGLFIFFIGSIIAATSDSIGGVLFGRLVQGAGAISAVLMALLADLTREEERTKAMAYVGASIGIVFMLSMVAGPLLGAVIGVSGIFWLTALLTVAAVVVLVLVTPNPVNSTSHLEAQPVAAQIIEVLQLPELLRLDFGVFCLHAVITSLFVVVPVHLLNLGDLPQGDHWQVYVPVMAIGIVGMVPLLILGHRRRRVEITVKLGISLLVFGLFMLWAGSMGVWWLFLAGLALFFIGFNTLEAMLPSLLTKTAPAANKGTATGVYNSAQFFGMFVGGFFSGLIHATFGSSAVFLASLFVIIAWLVMVQTAPAVQLYESRLVRIGAKTRDELAQVRSQLAALEGVVDVTVVDGDETAYLKINPDYFDDKNLSSYS